MNILKQKLAHKKKKHLNELDVIESINKKRFAKLKQENDQMSTQLE